MIKQFGADEVVDYKQSEDAQVDEIVAKTGGKGFKAYDTTSQNLSFGSKLFKKTAPGDKSFTSTNDWDPLEPDGYKFSPVSLGPIGRLTFTELNDSITGFLPFVYQLIEEKKIWPSESITMEKVGMEGVVEG